MANDLVQRVAESVQDSMDEILAKFKPGARISVLVRTPGKPTADFCMTDDDLEEVIAMVRRRQGEALTTSPKVEGPSVGLKPIPIEAAKRIAKEYGYDQVLIYARRCHDTPEPHGEHMTTYGRNREHCNVAARIGDTLKKFMGWEV